MKSKTIFSLIIIVMLMSLTVAIFVGCDNDNQEEPKDYTPGDAFAEVGRRIMESDKMQLGKQMSVDISIDILLKNNRNRESVWLELFVRGNANFYDDSTNADNNFILEINNKGTESKLIGLYADGEFLYVDLENEHYKVENFKLRDMLMGRDSKTGRALDLESVFKMVGDLLFQSVSVDGDTYKFGYDIGKTVDKYDDIFIELIGREAIDKLATSLGFDNWEHLSNDVLGELKGDLIYSFDRKGNLSSQELKNTGDKNSFTISAPQFVISDGSMVIDFDSYIDKDVEWITTKLMNIKMMGKFNLISDGKAVGVYDWELITNLDPLELMANQGDFNLDEDDMAHFIVKARMDKSTKEYNDSKVKAANGVVLELAYSPKEFKNNNLMITFNPKALLTKELVKALGIPEIAMGFLPDFYGAHLDVDMLREIGNVGKIEQKSGSKGGLSLGDLLGAVVINGEGLTIDTSILTALPGDIGTMLSSLFTVGGKMADKLNLEVEYCKFGDRTNGGYNVKEHFLYIADPQNNVFKDFSGTTGFIPAKESTPINNNGYIEITTATGKKINTESGAMSISMEELPTLIGGKISYNYTDFMGVNHNATTPVKILGVSQVDASKIGVEQSINLITSIPDGKNLLSLIGALNIMPDLPGNVYTTKIIISSEKSATMSYDKELSLKVGDELVNSDLGGKLDIVYDNDSTYSYTAKDITNPIKTLKIGGKSIISEAGVYRLGYNVGGRLVEREVTVAAADSVDILLNSNTIGKQGDSIDKVYGVVKLHYGDTIIEHSITADMITFPNGAVEDGKLKVAGEYYININCFQATSRVLVMVEPLPIVLPN